MLVLLFITPVFERIPYSVMGAVVISSVIGLFEISEAVFLFKANFLDFLVWVAAFLGTVFLGVEIGLVIAIGLAVALVIYQSAFPHTAVLGCLPETGALLAAVLVHWPPMKRDIACQSWYSCAEIYRNRKQYPSAEECPHVCIVR